MTRQRRMVERINDSGSSWAADVITHPIQERFLKPNGEFTEWVEIYDGRSRHASYELLQVTTNILKGE